MHFFLSFISDYLLKIGYCCRLVGNPRRKIRAIRMLRQKKTEFNSSYIYVCRAQKYCGEINSDSCYIIIGEDDERFQNTDRIIVSDGVSAADVFDRILDMFDSFSQWKNMLSETIASNGSIQELLALSSSMFDMCTISAVSRDLQILGYIKNSGRGESGKYRTIDSDRIYMSHDKVPSNWGTSDSIQPGEPFFQVDSLYGYDCRVLRYNIYSKAGLFLCRVTVSEGESLLLPFHAHLIEILGDYIRKAILRDERNLVERGRIGSKYVLQLLLGEIKGENSYLYASEKLKLEQNGMYNVIIFSILGGGDEEQLGCYQYVNRMIHDWCPRAKAVFYSNQTVVLYPQQPKDNNCILVDRIQGCDSFSHFQCGVSLTVQGFEALPDAYQQAVFAHSQAEAKNVAVDYSQCLYQHVINTFKMDRDTSRYLCPAVRALAEYDKSHSSNLVETLYYYLLFDRSYLLVTEKLMIHRSTLRYRLDLIKDVTQWNNIAPEGKENILISAKLYLDTLPCT